MADLPNGFEDESSMAQALGLNAGTVAAASASAGTGFATVNAPTLLQSISSLGAGTAIGGGQGVGGMNFNELSGGVQDFFQAAGAADEAKEYALASTYASQEAEFTKESTSVQNAQASRNVMMTIGAGKSQEAAAGLVTSAGSNLQLLHESAQQSALGHQMITLQGGITEAGYQEQAKAYTFMKNAEYTAENGDIAGGVVNSVLGIVGL